MLRVCHKTVSYLITCVILYNKPATIIRLQMSIKGDKTYKKVFGLSFFLSSRCLYLYIILVLQTKINQGLILLYDEIWPLEKSSLVESNYG